MPRGDGSFPALRPSFTSSSCSAWSSPKLLHLGHFSILLVPDTPSQLQHLSHNLLLAFLQLFPPDTLARVPQLHATFPRTLNPPGGDFTRCDMWPCAASPFSTL